MNFFKFLFRWQITYYFQYYLRQRVLGMSKVTKIVKFGTNLFCKITWINPVESCNVAVDFDGAIPESWFELVQNCRVTCNRQGQLLSLYALEMSDGHFQDVSLLQFGMSSGLEEVEMKNYVICNEWMNFIYLCSYLTIEPYFF